MAKGAVQARKKRARKASKEKGKKRYGWNNKLKSPTLRVGPQKSLI